MSRTIAVIVKGYPRLSETFIADELRGLERCGFDIRIVSLRRPTDSTIHPVHREIAAPVLYLPEYLHDAPARVFRAWRVIKSLPGYGDARGAWLADLKRDPSRNRTRRFGQAVVLAHELSPDVEHLHAHFLHTPASVARYASLILGLPWSCSAHAKDIWTSPEWEKRDKLRSLEWLVTCTRAGAEHLAALASEADKVELVYHGLDLVSFPPPSTQNSSRDGRDAANPVRILSVGRLVEKKGYADLLAALAALPSGLNWRLAHVGGGPLLRELKRHAARVGIGERIEWLGALPRDEVLDQYRRSDLFVLASRVSKDGDRDGLPNVLVEAASQGLACVSTTAGAARELIEPGANGLLVAPGNPIELSKALERLIREPALRAHFGAAAQRRVRIAFDFEPGLERIAAKLGLAPCALHSTHR
ncbi:MAG TPA: glycosyltransferase family 4 protein [Alphaproteobacteria bacterium]|nr:glycosyltransferase family 4 protein [Alphaproteobacteria bacterium]